MLVRPDPGTDAARRAAATPGTDQGRRGRARWPILGVTLLELLLTIAVIGILAALAAPAMQSLLTRNHLRAAAQVLVDDLQWTRSETIKRRQRLQLALDPQAWCYGVGAAAGTACDCRLPPQASGGCTLKRRSGAEFPGVSLTATFAAAAFEPKRATATAGSITLSSAGGERLKVVLSRLGRVRVCAPEGAILGHPPC